MKLSATNARLMLLSLAVLICSACGGLLHMPSYATSPAPATVINHQYGIKGNAILCDGKPIIVRGINAMHIYNSKIDPDVFTWSGINIIREFVGDLRDNPIKPGEIFSDEKHHTLHSLQDTVNENRKYGIITIVCPFGWDGASATEFTGCTPQGSTWYADYKARMREWAKQFKGQSDVWVEVMNEPFKSLQGAEGDKMWLSTMTDMVDNLRSAGWDGIILVPGSAWGGDEAVIMRQ